ncbi:MAG: universal stress protein [Salinivenus sp.]
MLSIQRILFPTDFSEGSKRAFPQAAFLADWHDAELHVVNVTGRHEHDYKDAKTQFPIGTDTLNTWLRRPSRSNADANWPDLGTMPIVQEQIESSAPAEALVDYVEANDLDLVVMGTHGRRGVNRMLFGSVTEEVVRAASCPVLTVRADAERAPDQAVRRVLVPTDFSDASLSALRHAKEIAMTYGAEIDLLHVVDMPTYPSAYDIDPVSFPTAEVLERTEEQLGDLAREEIGYEHVMVSSEVGHPAHTILTYVEEQEVDLVVIATHGRTGLDRLVLGSVTERVLRQSPTPVFVVKPDTKSLLPAAKPTTEDA